MYAGNALETKRATEALDLQFVRTLFRQLVQSKSYKMYSAQRSLIGGRQINLVRRLVGISREIPNVAEPRDAKLGFQLGAQQCSSSTFPSPPELRLLEGQVAVITGGASGIGAGTARLFSRHGARVVIADMQDSLGEEVAKECGPQAEYVHCDVRKEDDIVRTWEKAFSLDNKLDIVFNNAGIGLNFSSIDTTDMAEFDSVMNVNLRAVVAGVKHAARLMKPAGKGSILCTSSTASVLGGMAPAAYTISKSAVLGLVRQAAAELQEHGISVNALSPACVPTPILWKTFVDAGIEVSDHMRDVLVKETAVKLKNRSLGVQDVANAALYLCSDMGAMVSGHNLVLDVATTTSGNSGSKILQGALNCSEEDVIKSV